MHSRRNSLTIGLLLIILIVGGIFWYKKETKKLHAIVQKNEELKKKLDGSLEIAQALKSTEEKYRLLKQRWDDSPKIILAVDEPSFSLNYLNWLIISHNIPIEFDFVLDNVVSMGEITTFIFTLTGEGSYYDIYRLILFLTENPLLYQIESFVIHKNEKSADFINFKMQIKGFSLTTEWESAPEFNFESMKPVVETSLFHDAFKSLSSSRPEPKYTTDMFQQRTVKPIAPPKPRDEGLVDIEKATLLAVANGRIYIKDSNGKLLTLKTGDRVRSGNLSRINTKKSEVEFILDKDGTNKKFTLGLDYKK